MKGKVWAYCSSKELTDEMINSISSDTQIFLDNWKAHGTPLTSSFEIRSRRFLIITVDEESYAASGCSIDKQLQFVKEVEKKYNIELLNRLLVPYKTGDRVEVVPASKVKEFYQLGQLNADTVIYNPAVGDTEELENKFEIPLKDSWLKAKV